VRARHYWDVDNRSRLLEANRERTWIHGSSFFSPMALCLYHSKTQIFFSRSHDYSLKSDPSPTYIAQWLGDILATARPFLVSGIPKPLSYFSIGRVGELSL
jgi:hypothetical protein